MRRQCAFCQQPSRRGPLTRVRGARILCPLATETGGDAPARAAARARHASTPRTPSMLTIKVVSYRDQPLDQAISAEFGETGGTIGRSPDSTLLLPDPDRVISRTHAVVECRGGRFVVRDQGSTVAVIVNGRPVGRGHEQPLAAGDEVRIAGYALRVDGGLPSGHDVSSDDTTTILREGTFLSWSEDGKAVPQDRIATVIVDKNYAHVTALTDRNVVLVKGQVAYECDSATARADPAALHAYLGV